ncbi:hypothetical protein C8R47DRAFT_1081646 [Mycena vitilis]|nr:hypothetical protein C8R47DRAFT_1081646 [Mycena vitilis]
MSRSFTSANPRCLRLPVRRPPSRSSSTSRRAPDAPPDLWGPLRQIPEQDWARIRDLACPRNLDNVDDTVIAEFLAGYSAKLRASVHGCLPYLGDDVMPIELLAFHQGLKEAVKRLPEDFIQDHELDGIIWPLDAFESTDPPCLSRAEAKSLQRPMPVPYAVSRAEATPAPTPVVSRRPPPVASSPVGDYPFDFAARLQGSFFPPGLRREPTRAVDEDVNMEDPEGRHDEPVASLPVDKAPLPSRRPRPIPRFPGSGSGSRQRAGETGDQSAMPPPASASVSSSSRQPSASSETSRDTTVAPRATKVKPEPVSANLSGKGKKDKNPKGSQDAPVEVSDSEQPPANGIESNPLESPGCSSFRPPPDILNLPAAATEEHLGGPGSLAHLKASAKIQDKEEEEPEVEIVGESMAEAGGEEFNTPRIRAKNEKRPTQALFSELLALLPAKERQDLPRSDDGKYYKISYDLIREVMRVTDPMFCPATNPFHEFGPRCNVCQMSGNVCRVRGYPAMCDTCLRGHGSKICNLAQPDEINNDVWGSLMAYTDLSCESWKQTRETLGQSFKALESLESTRNNLIGEYQFNLLKYLVSILRARRELTTGEFWERFDNETSGETLLRLAMAQQLTAETEVTRAYVWQYCEFEYLHLDLPLFKSAYDFYRTVDEARGELDPPGYYLVPASDRDGLEPRWVSVSASEFDTVAKDEGKVPAGIRSGDIRRRLRFEKAFEDGQGKARSVPRDTHGTAFPHGTGLRPTGFLEKLWTAYGPALFDIEAEESSGESSSEEDSDLSDNARAEMEFLAEGRATRKQARRDRQPDHPRRPRPDTAVSSPATPRASGSNVVLPGEIKRPVVRRSPGKPRVAPKSDAMVVDSDAGGS